MNQQRPDNFEQGYEYVFTVFTPTFNRASTLYRVYDSLKAQTYRNFEWLIVDDGSTDHTHQLIEQWQKESGFPIRYIYQENKGKHFALNRGIKEAKGELFLTIDSDDACVAEALERFKSHWDAIENDSKYSFSGVAALCEDQNGILVGNLFPFDITDSDYIEIKYRFNVWGEKWGFQRTDILKEFPFPEDIEKTCLPEGLVWDKIAKKYKTRYVNEILRVYWTDQPSLTRGNNPSKNAVGGRMYLLSVLDDHDQIKYFIYNPLLFFRLTVHYSRFGFHIGVSLNEQFKDINTALGKLLWVLVMPVAYLVYLKDKIYHE